MKPLICLMALLVQSVRLQSCPTIDVVGSPVNLINEYLASLLYVLNPLNDGNYADLSLYSQTPSLEGDNLNMIFTLRNDGSNAKTYIGLQANVPSADKPDGPRRISKYAQSTNLSEVEALLGVSGSNLQNNLCNDLRQTFFTYFMTRNYISDFLGYNVVQTITSKAIGGGDLEFIQGLQNNQNIPSTSSGSYSYSTSEVNSNPSMTSSSSSTSVTEQELRDMLEKMNQQAVPSTQEITSAFQELQSPPSTITIPLSTTVTSTQIPVTTSSTTVTTTKTSILSPADQRALTSFLTTYFDYNISTGKRVSGLPISDSEFKLIYNLIMEILGAPTGTNFDIIFDKYLTLLKLQQFRPSSTEFVSSTTTTTSNVNNSNNSNNNINTNIDSSFSSSSSSSSNGGKTTVLLPDYVPYTSPFDNKSFSATVKNVTTTTTSSSSLPPINPPVITLPPVVLNPPPVVTEKSSSSSTTTTTTTTNNNNSNSNNNSSSGQKSQGQAPDFNIPSYNQFPNSMRTSGNASQTTVTQTTTNQQAVQPPNRGGSSTTSTASQSSSQGQRAAPSFPFDTIFQSINRKQTVTTNQSGGNGGASGSQTQTQTQTQTQNGQGSGAQSGAVATSSLVRPTMYLYQTTYGPNAPLPVTYTNQQSTAVQSRRIVPQSGMSQVTAPPTTILSNGATGARVGFGTGINQNANIRSGQNNSFSFFPGASSAQTSIISSPLNTARTVSAVPIGTVVSSSGSSGVPIGSFTTNGSFTINNAQGGGAIPLGNIIRN